MAVSADDEGDSAAGGEPSGRRIHYFGDYELLAEIARGGMGVVYRARQVSLNRVVAVKMILAGQLASEADVKRFRAEAEAAANLKHPNIVVIHEIGEFEGQHYFSMDCIEGKNLAELVRDKPWNAARAARCVKTVAKAIHYAHERGILHRDLKPSNVLIDQFDRPHVTDFGLAKQLNNGPDLTLSGQILGSPSFMPPEQAGGKRGAVGPHSDVYALGAILYCLLTSRPPFVAETAEETLMQVLTVEPVSPRKLNPSVPRDLETLCLKCLEKEPSRRCHSAEELAEELDRFLNGDPIHARPVSTVEKTYRWCKRKPALAGSLAVLVLAVILGTSGVLWQWRRAEQNAASEMRQRQRVVQVLDRMELQEAQERFDSNDAASGLAYLAQHLRRNPTSSVAADRLFSALTYRNLPVPTTPAMRHGDEITSAEFSPDGSRVLTASKDQTARIWDTRSAQPVTSTLKHAGKIWAAHFSPDGHRVVTASEDKTIKVWDASTGREVLAPIQHEAGVRLALYNPGGQMIASAATNVVNLWNSTNGERVAGPLKHESEVSLILFNPDGRRVVTFSTNTMYFWEAQTGKLLIQPVKDIGPIQSAVLSPDGHKLLVASADGWLRLFDADNGDQISGYGYASRIESVNFSPDSQRAVIASWDNAAMILDFESGKVWSKVLRHGAPVVSARFSSDGLWIVTASMDNTARLWDARTGKPLMEPLKHNSYVNDALFSPDAATVLTVSRESFAQLWDVRPGQSLPLILRHDRHVNTACFDHRGQRVLTASTDGTARIWNARTGEPLLSPFQHGKSVGAADFSPDGHQIVTICADNTVRVWDARTGAIVSGPLKHEAQIRRAQFSPDGQRLVTSVFDNTARIWDLRTGQSSIPPLVHKDWVHCAQFSPDGRLIVTASKDHTARVWDSGTGQPVTPYLKHDFCVHYAGFSPDGQRVVTTSEDGTARLWDAHSGAAVFPPFTHDAFVVCAKFSPDGTRMASASHDKTVRIWDLLTGQPVGGPLRHESDVLDVDFSPDGQRLVSACSCGTIRIWDVQTGLPLSDPLPNGDSVATVRFSPDGGRVVAAGEDNAARVWEVPSTPLPVPGWLPDLAEFIARQRLSEQAVSGSIPLADFLGMKERIRGGSASGWYGRWANWFFDERAARKVSPQSTLTVSDFVQRQIRGDTVASLSDAVRLAPTNAIALAGLARAILTSREDSTYSSLPESDFLSRRALALAPEEPDVWATRAEFWDRTRKPEKSSQEVDWILHRHPENPHLWNAKGMALANEGKWEEALAAHAKAIELAEKNPSAYDQAQSKASQNRSRIFQLMGRAMEVKGRSKGIPPRDPKANFNLIDLSGHYNAALTENWRGRLPGNDLSTVPTGVQKLAGVDFDVRGIMQLSSARMRERQSFFPAQVKGIEIKRKCRKLHFLHGAGGGDMDRKALGKEIVTVVLHYASGDERSVPIVYGQHVKDFWNYSFDKSRAPKDAVVAWTGTNEASRDMGATLRLYKATWDNPLPEIEIESIEYISKMITPDLFVIAITAEP